MLNIIDVEASGLQSGSYPVEVGVAFANGERLSMLIKPEPEDDKMNDGAKPAPRELTSAEL